MGDMAAAAKVGWAAIKVIWLQGIMPLRLAWAKLVYFLRDAWDVCSFALAKAASNTWYGILFGLKAAGDAIADTWDFLWDSVVNVFEGYVVYPLLKLGSTLWYGLKMGMAQAGDAIKDTWAYIWNGIMNSFDAVCKWMEKRWIQLKGIFDSKSAVNAALKAVDEKYARSKDERERQFAREVNGRREQRQQMTDEYNRTMKSYDQARDQGKAEREQRSADNVQRRERERADLKDKWAKFNEGIDAAQNDALMANKEKYDKQVAAAGRDLAAATAEWQDAMKAIKSRANEPGSIKERARGMGDATSAGARRGGMTTDLSGKTAGSFSARALAQMVGGGNAAERTARATEASRKQLERLNGNIERRQNSSTAIAYGS